MKGRGTFSAIPSEKEESLRYIAILLLFLCSVSVGQTRARRLEERVALLRRLKEELAALSSAVRYTRRPLSELCKTLSEGPARTLLTTYLTAADAGSAPMAAQTAALNAAGLTEERERGAAAELLTALCSFDAERIRLAAAHADAELAACLADAEEKSRGGAKLWRALGVLGGAALAILLL